MQAASAVARKVLICGFAAEGHGFLPIAVLRSAHVALTRSDLYTESGQHANVGVRSVVVVGIAVIVDIARVRSVTRRSGTLPPVAAIYKP